MIGLSTRSLIHTSLTPDCLVSVKEYLHLEQKIEQIQSQFCNPFCMDCRGSCCKEDICQESISSDWLRLVWHYMGQKQEEYDPDSGWLTRRGCALKAGRPPVCYEFICNRVFENLPQNMPLMYLRNNASLLSSAGKNALGSRHLVTLSLSDILHRLNHERLQRRIHKARQLLSSAILHSLASN